MESGLYIVGTPIGNLGDISFRALETLREVDLIVAEDTRHTRRLTARYEISTRMMSLNLNSCLLLIRQASPAARRTNY